MKALIPGIQAIYFVRAILNIIFILLPCAMLVWKLLPEYIDIYIRAEPFLYGQVVFESFGDKNWITDWT